MTEQDQALEQMERELKFLMQTSMGRRAFLASVGVLMAACASPEKTRYREGDNTGQEVNLTPEQEAELTREALKEMSKDYPQLEDPDLQTYISGLGKKLVQANSLEGNPYHYNFSVVDVKYVNAFALPAGTVFVTAPLIAMAETEAELVGVLGHEVGHIQARHTAERMFKAQQAQRKTLLYVVSGGLLGGAVGYGLGRLTCSPQDRACLQRAAELGAMAGAGGGLLVQKYAFMANSREDEMEADRIGFRTAVQAGYDKDLVGRFYDRLLEMESQSRQGRVPLLDSLADAMSTHPPSQERVDQMRRLAQAESARPGAISSSRDFDLMRQRAQRAAERAQS